MGYSEDRVGEVAGLVARLYNPDDPYDAGADEHERGGA